MEFLLADEEVTGYGFRLLMSGLKLDRFLSNPIMFYNHDRDKMPIGRWDNVRVTKENTLVGVPVFDQEDPDAMIVAGKVERGFIRAASVSLSPIQVSADPALMLPGQSLPTITEWEIEEVSIVNIPGIKNALRLMIDGKPINLNQDSHAEIKQALAQISTSKLPMKRVLLQLNLPENATEEQALEAMRALTGQVTQLNAKVKQLQDLALAQEKEAKEAIVDEAISSGKLDASKRAVTLKLIENADLEASRQFMADLKPASSVASTIVTGNQNLNQERSQWTIRDWESKDSKGLLELKKQKPDEYSRLFKAYYGVDFS